MTRLSTALLALAVTGLLIGGCGRKGPLYLPDPAKTSRRSSHTAPPPPATAPEQETRSVPAKSPEQPVEGNGNSATQE